MRRSWHHHADNGNAFAVAFSHISVPTGTQHDSSNQNYNETHPTTPAHKQEQQEIWGTQPIEDNENKQDSSGTTH